MKALEGAIRSLTASLFAGSFVAALFLNFEKWWKMVTLVAVSIVVVFDANLRRSLFLTARGYHRASRAIEGAIDDIAGHAVPRPTFLGLVRLVWLLNPATGARESAGRRGVQR